MAGSTARGRRATSADVAREAGVSRATVSFVLNDTPGQSIPEPTRQRVLDAARTLRYQPSAAARTLRSGRSDIVLLLMPNWSAGEVVARTMDVLSQEFSDRGMTFLVHPRAESNRNLSELWRTVTPAMVVTDETLGARELATLAAAGIPHLALGIDAVDTGEDTLQEDVGRIQAAHLVGLGHTRLGYAATPDLSLAAFLAARLRGVRAVCAEHGLPAPVVRDVGHAGADAGAVLAWTDDGVTAVAAYNDEIALAVLAGARDAGVSVPGALSVVGADDVAIARFASPPLTTVRLDPASFVPGLVDMIMVRLGRGEAAPRPPADRAEVVVRGSAASPGARR